MTAPIPPGKHRWPVDDFRPADAIEKNLEPRGNDREHAHSSPLGCPCMHACERWSTQAARSAWSHERTRNNPPNGTSPISTCHMRVHPPPNAPTCPNCAYTGQLRLRRATRRRKFSIPTALPNPCVNTLVNSMATRQSRPRRHHERREPRLAAAFVSMHCLASLWSELLRISLSELHKLAASLTCGQIDLSDHVALFAPFAALVVRRFLPISTRCIILYCPCSAPHETRRRPVQGAASNRIINHAPLPHPQ
jgi:hypothetical protein